MSGFTAHLTSDYTTPIDRTPARDIGVDCVQVMEVDVDMLTCQVTEGLTEDAVSARLHQGGLVPCTQV